MDNSETKASDQSVNQVNQVRAVQAPKSKTAAILLAVFLGSWAFLYTYKYDKTKFILSLGPLLVLVVAIVTMSVIVAGAPVDVQGDVILTDGQQVLTIISFFAIIIAGVAGLAFYIVAIVIQASRPDEFFLQYGASDIGSPDSSGPIKHNN